MIDAKLNDLIVFSGVYNVSHFTTGLDSAKGLDSSVFEFQSFANFDVDMQLGK